jgi:N-acetylglutamate synthase-like GNAT family acetyltransferase
MIRETTCYDTEDVLHLAACQSHEDQRYAGVNESFKDLYAKWKKKGLTRKYDGEIFHIVDERDGEIVGICGMSISTDGQSLMGELVSMYVKPEYRRMGVALGLLKRIVEIARKKGVEFIFAWTRHEATAATALYEKAGMKVNIQPVYYLSMFKPRPASPVCAD